MPLSTLARDRGRELAQRRRESELARQVYLADLHPACPRDGLPGTYIGVIAGTDGGIVGAVGMVAAAGSTHLAFNCPRADTFAYSAQTGAVWSLSHADEPCVHMEALNRLNRGDAQQQTAGASGWSLLGPPPL
jgi:hypothetical protein